MEDCPSGTRKLLQLWLQLRDIRPESNPSVHLQIGTIRTDLNISDVTVLNISLLRIRIRDIAMHTALVLIVLKIESVKPNALISFARFIICGG